MEQAMPVLTFSAKAGPHLPTPEEWKAELTYRSLVRLQTNDNGRPIRYY